LEGKYLCLCHPDPDFREKDCDDRCFDKLSMTDMDSRAKKSRAKFPKEPQKTFHKKTDVLYST